MKRIAQETTSLFSISFVSSTDFKAPANHDLSTTEGAVHSTGTDYEARRATCATAAESRSHSQYAPARAAQVREPPA